MIHVTNDAKQYLITLLKKQSKNTQIRILVKNPGTKHAKCEICYCFPNTQNTNDIIINLNDFHIYIEKTIAPFIKDTIIDIISNDLTKQLTIKSPNIYQQNYTFNTKKNKPLLSLEEKIRQILEHQINPQLAMHGGGVSLIKITQDSLAILEFHGGCNGCSMSRYTIKEGIENTLKNILPELKGVIDATNHQKGSHSYY